ncbi:MAG: hypothetical protein JWQ07_3477, partial [Ramlibacter sp.]|nr:hypothetical protein [Ramlibacter sp.]
MMAGACLCGSGTAVAATAPAGSIALVAGAAIPLSQQPQAMVPRGSLTVGEAAAGRLDSRLAAPESAAVALSPDNELWIPLRLHNPSDQSAIWQLQVAQPSIDEVTLFDARGKQWSPSSAGDRVEQSLWPRHGRYPSFDLRFTPGETRQLFVRVRSSMPASVPVRLVGEADADAAEQLAHIGLGFLLGALTLLAAACMVQAVLYRDASYALYGSYALLLGLSYASISG